MDFMLMRHGIDPPPRAPVATHIAVPGLLSHPIQFAHSPAIHTSRKPPAHLLSCDFVIP